MVFSVIYTAILRYEQNGLDFENLKRMSSKLYLWSIKSRIRNKKMHLLIVKQKYNIKNATSY